MLPLSYPDSRWQPQVLRLPTQYVIVSALQIKSLPSACRDQIMGRLRASTVLEIAAAVDTVDDQTLLDACLDVWSTSEKGVHALSTHNQDVHRHRW